MGDLERGRADESERFYRAALAVDHRLAVGDPTSITAQGRPPRLGRTAGDLVASSGRRSEAVDVCRDYLIWAESQTIPTEPIWARLRKLA